MRDDRTRAGTRSLAALCLLLAAGLVAAGPLTAQTPATSLGLGFPVPSIDARSAALGGTSVGLPGANFSASNPANIALFQEPVLGITYAPERVTVKSGDRSAGTGRSRLGVLRGAVPFYGWAVGLSIAPELDQDWQVSFQDTLTSQEGTFPYTEQRTSDGGVSSVSVSLARRLGRVKLGAEIGFLTGHLQQRYRRDFESDVEGGSGALGIATGVGDWAYSGTRLRFGATTALTPRIQLGGDFFVTNTLTARRDTIDGRTLTRKFNMPIGFEVGGSARVTESVLVSGAGGWTGWGETVRGTSDYDAFDTTWFGVGAEVRGFRMFGADVPLRFGVRRTELPFAPSGAEQLTEQAVTLGFGVRVAEDKARVDMAFELGSRGDTAASGVEESFRRVSLSLSLFQH